jgi:putative ABC transport system substrate-binding protein
MKRRAFIAGLGGAVTWPVVARAQQPAMPVIGWLCVVSAGGYADRVAVFREGLKEAGFVENQNVTIEYRWADDHVERLPGLAAELLARRVAVLVAGGGTSTALAAKAATTTTPIVFTTGGDPVRAGVVRSLNRPGENITGISALTDALITKRLELLTELVPGASVIGILINPSNPNSQNRANDLRAAAQLLGRQIRVVGASSGDELDHAFTAAGEQGVNALVVQNDAVFNSRPDELAGLAMRHRLPAIFENQADAAAGGLMSYGPGWRERYRLLGSYTGRILKGEKPADLPVTQPTKFELVINLKTAKALGLTVPPALLARADAVIECSGAPSSRLSGARRRGRWQHERSGLTGCVASACSLRSTKMMLNTKSSFQRSSIRPGARRDCRQSAVFA